MRERAITAVVLVPVLLIVLFLGGVVLAAAVALVTVLAAMEAFRLLRSAGHEGFAALGTVLALFVVLDAAHLSGIGDATFDKAAAIDFVEHIDDATLLSVLRETRRVLRPSGLLAIFTPCASHYVERMKSRNFVLHQTPGHIAVRDEAQYRDLLPQAGFDIESLYFSPSTYPFAGWLDRWLWKSPLTGPLFRFRLCIVAVPVNIASQR